MCIAASPLSLFAVAATIASFGIRMKSFMRRICTAICVCVCFRKDPTAVRFASVARLTSQLFRGEPKVLTIAEYVRTFAKTFCVFPVNLVLAIKWCRLSWKTDSRQRRKLYSYLHPVGVERGAIIICHPTRRSSKKKKNKQFHRDRGAKGNVITNRRLGSNTQSLIRHIYK